MLNSLLMSGMPTEGLLQVWPEGLESRRLWFSLHFGFFECSVLKIAITVKVIAWTLFYCGFHEGPWTWCSSLPTYPFNLALPAQALSCLSDLGSHGGCRSLHVCAGRLGRKSGTSKCACFCIFNSMTFPWAVPHRFAQRAILSVVSD